MICSSGQLGLLLVRFSFVHYEEDWNYKNHRATSSHIFNFNLLGSNTSNLDSAQDNSWKKNDAALISFCTNDRRTVRKCVKKIIFQHNHHHHHCSHLSHHPSQFKRVSRLRYSVSQ
jgi:hypothetical protein